MVEIRNNKGFSLVELMVVIGIVAILGAIGIPSMMSWLANKGLQSAARDLYSNMRRAQSTAVKNNRNCAITFDGLTGYLVYVDENKNFSYDGGERKIAEVLWSQYRNVQLESVNFAIVTGTKRTIAFQPNLLPTGSGGLGNGTAKLINSIPRELSVVVSVSGNISLR